MFSFYEKLQFLLRCLFSHTL